MVIDLFYRRDKGKDSGSSPYLLFIIVGWILVLTSCDFAPNNPVTTVPTSTGPVPHATLSPVGGVTLPETNTVSTPATNKIPPDPTGAPLAVSIPSPVPTSSAPVISVTRSISWGTLPNMASLPNGLGENGVVYPMVVTSDANFLLCQVVDRVSGTNPADVVLIDVHSRKMTKVRTLPFKDTQAYGTTADSEWIVWAEAAQNPGFFSDWTLYAYNIKSNSVKQIAKAPRDKSGSLIAGPDVEPKVDHGIVVWAEAPADQQDVTVSTIPVVKSLDLSTGQVRILAGKGRAPKISWPYVAWVEQQKENSDQLQGAKKGLIVVLNLQTGVKKTLTKVNTPRYFAIYGKSLVWITAPGVEVILTDMDETYETHLVRARGDDRFQNPMLNDRMVAWLSTIQAQVWDRSQNRLVSLESESVGFESITGNAFAWLSPTSEEGKKTPNLIDNKQTIYVLDTAQLPGIPSR
jgi:hypothetical protein